MIWDAQSALSDFRLIADLAGVKLKDSDIRIEELPAPHLAPLRLFAADALVDVVLNIERIGFERRLPLVPAFFQGPKQMHVAHLLHRPLIRVTFGSPIPTAELPFGKGTTIDLTRPLQAAIDELRSIADSRLFAA